MDITTTDLERVTSDFITMVSKLGLDATAEAAQIEGRIHLNVRTPDPGRMIGRRGKTLAAIQLLLNGMARRDKENFPRVFIDIDGYRSEGKGRFEHPKSEDGEGTDGETDATDGINGAVNGADLTAQDGEALVDADGESKDSSEREDRDDRPRRSRRPRRRSSRGADAAAEVSGTAEPAADRDGNESTNDANRGDAGSDESDNDGENGTDEQADGDAQPKRRRRSRRGGRRQRNKNARANGEERGEPRADGEAGESRGDSRHEGRGDSRNESRNDVPPPARRAMERREELPPLPAPPETITVQRAPEMPAATIDDVPPGPPAPPTVGRGPVGRSERGGRDGRRGRGRRDSRDGDRGGFREDSQSAYEVPRPAMASPEPVRRSEPMDDNERLRRLALDAAKEVHMWGEEKLLPPLKDEECQVVFEALSSHLHVSAEPGPKINDGRVRIVLKEKKH